MLLLVVPVFAPVMWAIVFAPVRWHSFWNRWFDAYRPELHYMRGPGPKWREKHGRMGDLNLAKEQPIADILEPGLNRHRLVVRPSASNARARFARSIHDI